jgi:hypothetical protein
MDPKDVATSDLPNAIKSLSTDAVAETVAVPLEDAHLLNVKGTVLKLENSIQLPYDFSMAQVVEGVVPVIDDEDQVIGHGALKAEGGELVFEGSIDYATPTRLSLQNGDAFFFHFVGRVEVIGAPKGRLERITKIESTAVILSAQRPLDYSVSKVVVIE